MNSTVAVEDNNQSSVKKGGPWLYRTIWRWHFYAGILVIPFVLMLAVTGSIYLFKPQIDAWVDKPFHNLTIGENRTTPNQQIDAALNAVPGSLFFNYQLPKSETEAVVVSVNDAGKRTLVYVNPYNLDVLKVIGYNDQFIRQVRTFHGELMAGNVGSVLVELAGCWAIVLIVTGLYLWWPRSANGLAGVVYPRLKQGGRVFWRDLHAVIGIWISAFTLFLLISGLPWSLVWGAAFKEVRSLPVFESRQAPAMAGEHDEHANHSNHQKTEEQTWSAGRAEEQAQLTATSTNGVSLSASVVATAQSLNFAPPVLLSMDKQQSSVSNPVWKLSSDHQNRPLRANAWINGNNANVIRQQSFADQPTINKVVGIGIAAHEGHLFGWFNQLLGMITTIGLTVLSISGLVMWLKRKPQKQLGAPKPFANVSIGKTVTGIIFVLALFLPLLAISLVAILLVEWLLLRRLKPAREWLGIT